MCVGERWVLVGPTLTTSKRHDQSVTVTRQKVPSGGDDAALFLPGDRIHATAILAVGAVAYFGEYYRIFCVHDQIDFAVSALIIFLYAVESGFL